MKKIYKLLFWSTIGFVLVSFNRDSNRINWSSYRQLTWADYQAQPDFNDNFRDAVTASAMVFQTKCDDQTGLLKVVMTAQFVKNQSWVKPVAQTDYHLGHEQLHFDIAELVVRRFRKAISTKLLRCDDYPEIQALSDLYMDQAHHLQMEYDRETRFSLHKTNQALWHKKIKEELKELKAFEKN